MKLKNNEHVVMVDDNEGDVYLAKICFEQSKVTNPWMSFPSGSTFLEFLEEVKGGEHKMPALALLDINMPGLSGLEVLKKVRQNKFFDELPLFCMLTSSCDPRDKAQAHELGASGFVTKPDRFQDYVKFFNSLIGE